MLFFSRAYASRAYASQAQKLSAKVKSAGKGKTVLALSKRQQLSIPKKRTIKPTTLDMGDFAKLKGVSVEERTVHRNLLEKVDSFDQLRIEPQVRDQILKSGDIRTPTAIQKVALKALSASYNTQKTWLLAAETGSGKTLAYLAPLLSRLTTSQSEKGPYLRSIVLVPTVELMDQVQHSVDQFAPPQLRAVRSKSTRQMTRAIVAGLDLLVTTPDKLLNLASHERVLAERVLPSVDTVVVDEADSLLNPSFSESTLGVIKKCEELAHLVFCTATIPNHFDKVLRDTYPECNRLITPSIHRLPRHIDFRVIEVWRPPYHDRKELALEQALYSIYNDNSEPGQTKRVVVFVNKRTQVEPLVKMLNKKGYESVGLDGKMDAEQRAELLEDFVLPPRRGTEGIKVLVATDLVARGIDMNRIRNVILYDQPWSAADLLHRAGRTGRLNTKGKVLLFVGRKDSKGWVKGLEKVVKQGLALA